MLDPQKEMIRLFKVFTTQAAAIAVTKTLDSGYIGQGPKVEEFEDALQEKLFLPTKPFCVTSATHGLDLAFHLLDIGQGDEVISTPITCTATNTGLALRGAKIIWADVIPETGLIDPEDVGRKVTKRTKAIVAVDWGGQLCDYQRLKVIGPPVIQDAAHSFGAKGEGGHFRVWSFQAIKHLTCGDGGALEVPQSYMERAELLRWYGLDRRKGFSFRCSQDIPEAGFKYGMNDIAASIGLGNLGSIDRVLGLHREHAWQFSQFLHGIPGVRIPKWDETGSWWLYTVLVNDQTDFIDYMGRAGVEASLVHDRNDTKSCFKDATGGDLPGADYFSDHHVCLPVGWWLIPADVRRIAEAVRAYNGIEVPK